MVDASAAYFAALARQCRAEARDEARDVKTRRNLLQLARHYESEARSAQLAIARAKKGRKPESPEPR